MPAFDVMAKALADHDGVFRTAELAEGYPARSLAGMWLRDRQFALRVGGLMIANGHVAQGSGKWVCGACLGRGIIPRGEMLTITTPMMGDGVAEPAVLCDRCPECLGRGIRPGRKPDWA